jgi:hypothetical protein
MPSITTILLLWGLVAPLAMYGWQAVSVADAEHAGRVALVKAVGKAERDGEQVCTGRIATITQKMASEALETAELARKAGERETELLLQLAEAKATAEKIGATADETKAVRVMVEKLCGERTSCREHARIKR